MDWALGEVVSHFVAIWGELNEPLRLLHEAILEEISPLRHGYYKQKYTSPKLHLTEEEERSLENGDHPGHNPTGPI
jgi:hypothetical protein